MTTRAAEADPLRPRLHRDRFTITLYGYLVTWGWFLYSFNPSVPLLARELGVSNAQAGLHGTAMAGGAILAAAVTPRLVQGIGRRSSMVLAGVVLSAGAAVLVTGHSLAATLTGVLVLAVGGNVAVSATQAGLAMHHGAAASAALTEANGVGALVGLIGPLAVGASVAAGWGWRPAVAVTAVLALTTAALVRRLPAQGTLTRVLREPRPRTDGEPAPTPGAQVTPAPRGVPQPPGAAGAWFLVAVVAAIAIENSTTYWATDLVIERTGAGPGIATATTAGLVAGMALIRFVVGPLSLRIEPAHLLAAAFGVAIGGWLVLWTATSPAVALAGLFVAGLGYGAQYPLSVSLLLGVSIGATDRAQARATIAGGAAIGVAPFVLGALADSLGAHQAFVIVPVFAVVGGAAALAGTRAARVRAAAG